jgi:hypothetical protein
LAPPVPDELRTAWDASVQAAEALTAPVPEAKAVGDQFLVLITCRDEPHQIQTIEWLQREGVMCKALVG